MVQRKRSTIPPRRKRSPNGENGKIRPQDVPQSLRLQLMNKAFSPLLKKQLWEIAAEKFQPGQPPRFYSPLQLWEESLQYFIWAKENPLMESKFVSGGPGEGSVLDELPKLRAFTLDGLQLYIGCDDLTWINYEQNPDYLIVTTQIRKMIREQKFIGASCGMLNANIIARDLGLIDKKDITSDGKSLAPKQTDEEAERTRNRMIEEMGK